MPDYADIVSCEGQDSVYEVGEGKIHGAVSRGGDTETVRRALREWGEMSIRFWVWGLGVGVGGFGFGVWSLGLEGWLKGMQEDGNGR